MTRIVGGRFGGRRITVPRNRTRPTTDRVREALFNVLAARLDFDGITVLDLYAGSGALGLEALSRGAGRAVFVEVDRRVIAVIAENANALGISSLSVIEATVAKALAAAPPSPFDLVLADPPYAVPAADVESMLTSLSSRHWVRDGTLAVVERAAFGPELRWPDGWSAWQLRRYGDTRLEFGWYGA